MRNTQQLQSRFRDILDDVSRTVSELRKQGEWLERLGEKELDAWARSINGLIFNAARAADNYQRLVGDLTFPMRLQYELGEILKDVAYRQQVPDAEKRLVAEKTIEIMVDSLIREVSIEALDLHKTIQHRYVGDDDSAATEGDDKS